MQTIVEPKQHIDRLWGKQQIREDQSYRLMKYLFRVDHEGKILLHNVVTGQLVVLDTNEAKMVDKLPQSYCSVMEQLVTGHYLVPEEFDEHKEVVNLRNILWKIYESRSSKEITYYTILPTTACNARCWYCFEQGIKAITMSKDTAEDVVKFIASHNGRKKVVIRWFGGEPTLSTDRIDQICKGLSRSNVDFSSRITSNGYLLNEEIVEHAKNIWNLDLATITVDGTMENHEKYKAFTGTKGKVHEIIMHNIKVLLEHKIHVGLRMNYDYNNCEDFVKLLDEVDLLYGNNPLLMVYARKINWDVNFENRHYWESWFNEKNYELNRIACERGRFVINYRLPYLFYRMCEASDDSSIVITPDGHLACCPEQIEDDQAIGNLREGIINAGLVKAWKQFADFERCRSCFLFPDCPKILNCNGKDQCTVKVEKTNLYRDSILDLAKRCINENEPTRKGGK